MKQLTIRDVPLEYELITSSWQVYALNRRYNVNFNAFFMLGDMDKQSDPDSLYGISGLCLAVTKEIYYVSGRPL